MTEIGGRRGGQTVAAMIVRPDGNAVLVEFRCQAPIPGAVLPSRAGCGEAAAVDGCPSDGRTARLEIPAREAKANRLHELLGRDRFRQHAITFEPRQFDAIGSGDDDDGNVARVRLVGEFLADHVPTQHRKHQIEHDEIWGVPIKSLERLEAVAGLSDVEPCERQGRAIESPKVGIVFDDQNRVLGSHAVEP